MSEQISFSEVSAALADTNAEMGAAECHGMFCGVLCANGQLNVEAMAAQVMGAADKGNDRAQASARIIGALLSETMAQLNGDDLGLQLLLPDDDTSLNARSAALGMWCQGFVMGLAAGGVSKDTKLQKDSNEILLDLTNIAHQLQPGEDEDLTVDEEEEAAYVEVEEYVRVGVMLINEELRAQRPDAQVH